MAVHRRKADIPNLGAEVPIEHDIAALDVLMHNAQVMHVQNASHDVQGSSLAPAQPGIRPFPLMQAP